MTELSDYRWPAEWEPHEATWAAWPVNPNTWPGLFDRIPAAFAAFVAAVARFEPVRILATRAVADMARPLVDAACDKAAAVHDVSFVDVDVNDSWCRDYGPIFLNRKFESSKPAGQIMLDWRYNAWGGRYPPWDKDDDVARRLAESLSIPRIEMEFVLEGGAIEGNGAATIATTRSCLLNANRNGRMTTDRWNRMLAQYMGAQQTIWLPGEGIVGDDTDGHIDQIVRFTSADSAVAAVAWDADAPEARDLRANVDALQRSITAAGETISVTELRLPAPKFQQGRRLPASYCNFCLCNGGIILPTFDDPADDTAAEMLQNAFPERKVVCISALELVWGLGAFHCLTQQQPRSPQSQT